MIEIVDLCKNYGKNNIIKNLNLKIKDNEFIVFLGSSGCGKTTLIRLIAGLTDVDKGKVLFNGRCVNDESPKKRNISMVFQNYALFPNLNVYENIAFGLKVRKYKKDKIAEMVNEVAKQLKIEPLLKRKPDQLSGGEQQRVAIARAMVKKPDVYLFDEPLSSLDVNLKGDIRDLIKDIHEKTKATFIYVTHDQHEALSLADRIAVMNEGKIIQIDTPFNLYNKPNSLFVAKFLGDYKLNKLPVVNEEMQCYVRPENVMLGGGKDENYITLKGKVVSNEFIGTGYFYSILLDETYVINLMSKEILDDINIDISIKKSSILFFDEKENRLDIKDINILNNKIMVGKIK